MGDALMGAGPTGRGIAVGRCRGLGPDLPRSSLSRAPQTTHYPWGCTPACIAHAHMHGHVSHGDVYACTCSCTAARVVLMSAHA